MLIASIVFAVVAGLVLVPYWVFVVRAEERSERDVLRRLKTATPGRGLRHLVKPASDATTARWLDSTVSRFDHVLDPLRRIVAQSGHRVSAGSIIMGSIALAAAVGGVMLLFGWPLVAAIPAGGAVGCVPFLLVRRRAAGRLRQFEEQFPEAIDLMARALRAGHTLPTALQTVGEEIQDPVGREFRTLFDQQNYGMALPDALTAFAERMPLLDARFFVTAVLTQREVGGNLAEILDNLATVIRERFKVKRQVRVASAHGRITGWVLGALPPVVALVLFGISPDHMRVMTDDPIGLYMVIGGIVLQCIGVIWIRRVVDVEY